MNFLLLISKIIFICKGFLLFFFLKTHHLFYLGPPNITTSLETNNKNRSVKLIGNVFIYDDSPKILESFWTRNVKTIDLEDSGRKLLEGDIDNPSLTIKNVSPDDSGEYRLTAINAVGLNTSEVIVLGISVFFYI